MSITAVMLLSTTGYVATNNTSSASQSTTSKDHAISINLVAFKDSVLSKSINTNNEKNSNVIVPGSYEKSASTDRISGVRICKSYT